ncbi:MAG: hypothetical protein ACLTYW_08030 [Collinsella sp.]
MGQRAHLRDHLLLGGSTPETVEANKTAKKHNCPVVSLTNKAGSALTVDADHVIVHGFHANLLPSREPGYAIALALEILQQTEGYDHYEDMITGLTNIFELIENAAHSARAWPSSSLRTSRTTR